MFKIGEFSKLSKVPVKTLRYYADIGLLPPARVDRFTNYRYYTVEQLPCLNRILALRDLGFSLDQIGRLLDQDLSAEQLRGMLRLRQAEIEQEIEAERGRLARVESRLRQIEQENKMSVYDVILKKVEPLHGAALRDVIPDYAHVGDLFNEMFQHLGANGAQPAGPPFVLYHDHEYKERDADVELLVPLDADLPATERIVTRRVVGGDMATCIMAGSYDNFGQAYTALMKWIESNDYRMAGPSREIYLRGPESTDNPDEYMTEIQVPVEKG